VGVGAHIIAPSAYATLQVPLERQIWLLMVPLLLARCNSQGVFQPPDCQCSHLGPLVLFCAADINSADCEGMATTVTAALHSIWRQLYDSITLHKSSGLSLSRLTTKVA